MSKEAMKLALEALETERNNYQDWDEKDGAPEYIYDAITALREALAEQPAQPEPVAWMQNTTAGLYVIDHYDEWHCIPLYTSPPAQRTWVGLTDEEIQTEWVLTPQNDKAEGIWFGRRIEAKLKEKNT